MKIVTAIDSMKGSLSSVQANAIIDRVFSEQGIVEQIAIADGGEGTVEAFINNYGGRYETIEAHNLVGEKIQATFGWMEKESLAVIESADTAGIQFLDSTLKTHPLNTSTQGIGETIQAAMDFGAKKIIIGLGGTGTIDGGIGALHALGFRFRDQKQNVLEPIGKNLAKIQTISTDKVDQRISTIEFILASDVTSYLTGSKGAVYMFGKQKGLREDEMAEYERSLESFQDKISENTILPGDGAAGGLGIGLRVFLKGRSVSGFSLVVEYSNLLKELEDADLVITGEGKIDDQSLQGKVPVGISVLSKKKKIPVIAFVGMVEGSPEKFKEYGIDVVLPTVDKLMTIEQAMEEAEESLYRVAQRTKDLLSIFKN